MTKSLLNHSFAIFLCLLPLVLGYTADFGVGFNLEFDYGTASIYFSNGTVFDGVKIEGGPAYKQLMRSLSTATTSRPAIVQTQSSLGFMPLRDYLPSWIISTTVDSDVEAMSWMLKGLKAATEAYVEAPLPAVNVVSPMSGNKDYHEILESALDSLALKRMLSHPSHPGLAARIYGIEGNCPYDYSWTPPDQIEIPNDPEQNFVAIDYNRAGISAFLMEEDCGYYECWHFFHNTSLGADSNYDGKRVDLLRAVQKLVRAPAVDSLPAVSESGITELLLLGESTDDAVLLDVLKEVFGDRYAELKDKSDRRKDAISPVFAASRGAAWDCQGRLTSWMNAQVG